MSRRARDWYPEPAWTVSELVRLGPTIAGTVLDPCAGTGTIARTLLAAAEGVERVINNDLDPAHGILDSSLDAAAAASWSAFPAVDWVISNPPFALAPAITAYAYDAARVGVAMLLRLSFLEPCRNRRAFLTRHPPSSLIVLPRISFTGDGGKDMATVAWMVWTRRHDPWPGIVISAAHGRPVARRSRSSSRGG